VLALLTPPVFRFLERLLAASGIPASQNLSSSLGGGRFLFAFFSVVAGSLERRL
jgi:hypothetical protein